jgi:hypothetical protein
MANSPRLKLDLKDVSGRPLAEPCDVMLRQQPSGNLKVTRVPRGKGAFVDGLSGAPNGVYLVEIDPASYLGAGRFVSMAASGDTLLSLTFPIDPVKVKRAVFPSFASLGVDTRRVLDDATDVLSFPKLAGPALYDAFDDTRKAGFLNIAAKSLSTPLTNKRQVASYFRRIVELRGDRFFVVTSQELREEVKNSAGAGLFVEAPSTLHHPPAGMQPAGSFKTPDHYANLQLTFFTNGTDWVADVDIDDANGLAHVFQVLRNQLTNRPTHPYDIHELLLSYQKLDPGYRLEV